MKYNKLNAIDALVVPVRVINSLSGNIAGGALLTNTPCGSHV